MLLSKMYSLIVFSALLQNFIVVQTYDTTDQEDSLSPNYHWLYNTADREYIQFMMSPDRLLSSVTMVNGNQGNDDGTQYNTSTKCRRDVGSIVESAVLKREIWAIKFLDAWGKLPPGVFLGNLVWSGSYGECIGLTSPTTQSTGHQKQHQYQGFVGKYCSVTFRNFSWVPTNLSGGFSTKLTAGVCFPDSCSGEDIHTFFATASSLVNGSYVEVFKNVKCQPTVRSVVHYTTGAIVMLVLLSSIVLLIILGTFYDVVFYQPSLKKDARTLELSTVADLDAGHIARTLDEYSPLVAPSLPEKEPISFLSRFVLCFSVYTNALNILSVGQQAGQAGRPSLPCLHGIRVLSINWILLSHLFYYSYRYSSFGDIQEVIRAAYRLSFQLVIGGSFAVDTFFLISGTLVAYLSLKKLTDKGGPRHFNWGLFYLHRLWRISPPYMLLLGLYTCFYQYMGEGPFWTGEEVSAQCKKTWWASLLYIDNFWRPDQQCMGWTWYLANDMQFYVVSPLILVLMYWRPKLGVIVCIFLLAGSCLSTGLISSIYHYQAGIPGLVHSSLHSHRPAIDILNDFFSDIYNRPWIRIGPYLIGLLLGLLLHKTELNLKLNRRFVVLGWLLMAVCTLSVLLGLQGVIQGSRSPNNHVSALFNALSRPVWALGVAWLLFACVHGYGGIINKILSWSAFVPLSRLTFMAYLVHPIFVTVYFLQLKQRLLYDTMTIIIIYFGQLVLAYLAAFILSLMFEAPMISLEKLLMKRNH